MAFGILVYENDVYLYTLIRERLSYYFPSAYIEKFGDASVKSDFKLISEIVILYDNRQYKEPSSDGVKSVIPLFTYDDKGRGIIRINEICSKTSGTPSAPAGNEMYRDRLKLLISFAYIDERENFIMSAIGPDTFDSITPIRIDLMSGIRMPNTFTGSSTGSISRLLRSCTDKRFKASMIPEYLNPDSNGFLSCGKPDNEDDVYDIGLQACTVLIGKLKELCIKENTEALVVVEGWRVSEIIEFIKICDTLHILLPARMCTEDTGMTKELDMFKRALPSGALMTVHYCEDYRKQYDTIRI